MKILVIGGGGREHALVWKLARDSCKPVVFCAPGNAGTAMIAENVPIQAESVKGLVGWVKRNKPDLTVVGPEAPLCDGLVDYLNAAGFRVFGPTRAAAQIEGSKVFSKDVMDAAGVPTARSAVFSRAGKALEYVRSVGAPIVIKADGLAAGKGVAVCATVEAAERAIRETMETKAFGDAGKRVVVEEFLEGEEASILALVDGKHVVMLASAQDHKRVGDNDTGPNTGGMGAYSPAPVVKDKMWPVIKEEVFNRTLAELRKRKIEYKGVLYAGLMIAPGGLKVLEFNCRFGDPETQVILPRMKSDLVPVLEACIDGTLKDSLIKWRSEAAVCVVMASEGYPGAYPKGRLITGLRQAGALKDTVVFHSGTKLVSGRPETAGGRVVGVTALGKSVSQAVAQAYRAVQRVEFQGAHYRKDIGARALRPGGKSGAK
ncbi:MAG: phosphoribosylamine--glycine ligase [bacterium]